MIARYERKEHGLKMRHIYEVVKGDDAESSVKVNNKLTWVGDFYPFCHFVLIPPPECPAIPGGRHASFRGQQQPGLRRRRRVARLPREVAGRELVADPDERDVGRGRVQVGEARLGGAGLRCHRPGTGAQFGESLGL